MRDQIARPGLSPPPVNTYCEYLMQCPSVHVVVSNLLIAQCPISIVVLRPVSALARVKVNLRPGTSLDVPQVFVCVRACMHRVLPMFFFVAFCQFGM